MGLPTAARSPQARAIADLFGDTLVVCAVVLAVVTVLIVVAMVRFRDRGVVPRQTEGNTRLEVAWTIVPVLVLAGLLVLTVRAMGISDPSADREPDLVIVAHQWWWEVRYKSGAVTANEIHIPVGTPLVVAIESADVVHDFWVPELARKMDAVPGRTSTIWLQADAPGTYTGACAEYCGAQHAWMRILVIAEPAADFAAWEADARKPAVTPASPAEHRGADLFAKLTCVKCHALGPAAGDAPRAGPDLGHLAARTTLGAGIMANTPAELARWLKHPQQIKEGSHMPDLQLGDTQVADLVAYFGSLR